MMPTRGAHTASYPIRSPKLAPHRRRSSGEMPDMATTFTELEFLKEASPSDLSRPASSAMELIAPTTAARSSEESEQNVEADANNANSIKPFLKTHIPHQYNPLGHARDQTESTSDKSNTKFCYRHRPDLKCRRQANEPSMEQLQRELGALPSADQQGISHVWSLFSAAPSKHRNLMLQGILAQCCFPQLSFIAASVRDLIKIDFLSVLPAELGLKVLCYLDPTSICKAAQVSRRWRQLADDDVVWHRMCEQHIDRKCTKCGWGLPLLDRKRLRTEKRQIQLRASGQHDLDQPNTADRHDRPHTHDHAPPFSRAISDSGRKRAAEEGARTAAPSESSKRRCGGQSPIADDRVVRRTQAWKDVYRDRFKIGTNWKYGRCKVQTFRGHTNGVMCVQFDDSVIVSGSYDATVKMWDIETGDLLRTFTGHTLGVRSLKFDDSKLVTGSLDNTVRIWNMETGQLLRTLTGHSDGVLCVHFDGHFVASGSKDHTIRVWNFATKSVFALRGHEEWVNSVKIDFSSRTLLSSSDDCTVRLWDLDTQRCLKVYTGHVAQIQQVLAMPRGFEPDGFEHMPSDRWHWDESDQVECREPRTDPPRFMMSGALSGNIRMWDCYTGRCIKTFFGHIEGVWGLTADTLRVVSGANDGMVKVWDPRTGACERTFTGHAGPVTCVGLSDRRMCSGSEDHEVRLYNFCA